MIKVRTFVRYIQPAPLTGCTDDLRTAKQQVLTHVRALTAYTRQQLSPFSTSGSSSGTPPLPATDEELDKAKLETMKRLIVVLQRNVQVRFGINMDELLQACVPSYC